MSELLTRLFSLEGKTAVVVGGTGVLCGRMAETLAGAGARVLIAGKDEARGAERAAHLRSLGQQAIYHPVDVAQSESVRQLLTAATRELGGIDILVNGAGVNSAVPYLDISEEDWRRVVDINLTGVHRVSQAFAQGMLSRRSGCIIHIASVSGLVPLSRVFAYSASKAAVLNYTMNLARELGPEGVRVNALTPGFFPAGQNRHILDAERTEKILARTPMGRFGAPEELDGALLLLASDRAGSFLTGANLVVDGGFSATSI